jgi:mono/diheme cytochrome c family protein
MRRATAFVPAFALLVSLPLAGAADPEIDRARQVFMIYCATCHGELGDGKGPVGIVLDPPPRDFTRGEFKYGGTDQDLFEVVTNGAASKGGSQLMAPWGAIIPESDRRALIKYIRSLKR